MGASWDVAGLTWDRDDLFWDLPANWLIIPHRFGLDTPQSHTPDLDQDFTEITTRYTADGGGAALTVPHTFASVGLHTPTAWLDANFAAVSAWVETYRGAGPTVESLPVPFTFSGARKRTPLSRLDANFDAVARWHNTHLI
jgi:hypothetical protein